MAEACVWREWQQQRQQQHQIVSPSRGTGCERCRRCAGTREQDGTLAGVHGHTLGSDAALTTKRPAEGRTTHAFRLWSRGDPRTAFAQRAILSCCGELGWAGGGVEAVWSLPATKID
jgi:hypothetical protein